MVRTKGQTTASFSFLLCIVLTHLAFKSRKRARGKGAGAVREGGGQSTPASGPQQVGVGNEHGQGAAAGHLCLLAHGFFFFLFVSCFFFFLAQLSHH